MLKTLKKRKQGDGKRNDELAIRKLKNDRNKKKRAEKKKENIFSENLLLLF